MAQEHTDRSDEIDDPTNPPNVLLRPENRRAALWSYLGPVIALFAIVGVALIYWVNRGPVSDSVRTDDAATDGDGAVRCWPVLPATSPSETPPAPVPDGAGPPVPAGLPVGEPVPDGPA